MSDERSEDELVLELAGSQELRPDVALLIGRYERAVGIIDNLLDLRLDVMGEHTAAALRSVMFSRRLRDEDRFQLLRGMLRDLRAEVPVDDIDRVLRDVQTLRNAAAHAADYGISVTPSGEPIVTFYPVLRRKPRPRPRPRTTLPLAELLGHLERLAWATHWLQHVEHTHPAFDTDSDWQHVWRATMQAPAQEPPPKRVAFDEPNDSSR